MSLTDGTQAGVCACVCPSVSASTLSNMNILENSWPIVIKFQLEHHWGKGLTELGFGLDRIRTLVFRSPEPKAWDELIGWDSSWRPSVCPYFQT